MTGAKPLDRVIATLADAYAGPGGAVAVVREGETLVRHAWGWANAERRIPFTPATLFRMCSITKQFTCGLLLDAFPELTALDGDVRARLPRLEQAPPGVLSLCHNQSGLRDYWALAMLLGAPAESAFGDAEAERLIAGSKTLQFEPGSRYSYCNQNFRILSDIFQARTGRSFAEGLRARLFDRAGMASALLAADTRAMPDGAEGYEGDVAAGFRAAENRILWTGDAGLGASLDDMIAWERFIDATRGDETSLYRRLSAPVRFSDGSQASYGFGLARRQEFGLAVTGHGGALRGWRSHRINVASERLSIVVMFNHMADAQAACLDILAAMLGQTRPRPDVSLPAPEGLGAFIEPETGLLARVDVAGPGEVRLRYSAAPERLALTSEGATREDATRLRWEADGVWMDRATDNQSSRLTRIEGEAHRDVEGEYVCDEWGATLTVADAGGALYGAFSGPLGPGRMEKLAGVAGDVWALPCPRALDFSPPGDWTLAFSRDANGRVAQASVGCWLARGLRFARKA